MRSYWVKIVFGAVLIFAVGMIIRTVFHRVKRGVEYVSGGSGPITSPLFFVPFELGGRRLGTFRELTIYRDTLQKPSSLALTISLRDSVTPADLAHCIVAMLPDSGNNFNPTRFTCLGAGDTAARKLAQFGVLHIRSMSDSFPLFAPAAQLEEIRANWGHRMNTADSAQRVKNDSLTESIHMQIESTMQQARDKAEALRATIPER
jgi:hypothetical protein